METIDKLPSNTLKRNPKMELSKSDLLKLLSYLEGEVQAREIVIATLKAERVKQLLYQAKYGHFALNDPFAALQRDSYGALGPATACDEAAIKTLYNNQLGQLENLVLQHRRAQQRLREHLREVVTNLEEERQKHALDTAEGDDVTYMLEKERERLRQEVEAERQQKKRLETELRRAIRLLESERAKQKQIVVLLLTERKLLISKLLDEHGRREELQQILTDEKGRMADVVDGLEEESQKSLQMEADLERQAAEFVIERASLENALERERSRVKSLEMESNALRAQIREMRLGDAGAGDSTSQSPTSILRVVTSSSPPPPPMKPENLTRCSKVNGAESPYSPGRGNTGGLLACAIGPPKCVSPVANAGETRRLVACVSPVGRSVSPCQQQQPETFAAIATRTPSVSPTQPCTAELVVVKESGQTHPMQVSPRVSGSSPHGSTGGRVCLRVMSSPPQAPQPPKKPPTTTNAPLAATVCCSSLARGAPPPVPPNKPVLSGPALQKKEAIVRTLVPGAAATSDASVTFDVRAQKAPTQGIRFGITVSKERSSGQPRTVYAASSSAEEGSEDAADRGPRSQP